MVDPSDLKLVDMPKKFLRSSNVSNTHTFAEFTRLHPSHRNRSPRLEDRHGSGGSQATILSKKKEKPLVSGRNYKRTRSVDERRYSKDLTFLKPAADRVVKTMVDRPSELRRGQNLANTFQALKKKESVREDDDNNNSKNIRASLSPRDRVWENITLFRSKCDELITLSSHGGGSLDAKRREFRVDHEAWKQLRDSGKLCPENSKVIGEVPGVEIGDQFFYRVELVIAGIHGRHINGIDFIDYKGVTLASSLVSTDGYLDKTRDHGDTIFYIGEGGGIFEEAKKRKYEKIFAVRDDQNLKRGNLALRNSLDVKNPIRVVRGIKTCRRPGDVLYHRAARTMFVYDGLYVVHGCKKIIQPELGNLIYQFELRRIPGQRSINC